MSIREDLHVRLDGIQGTLTVSAEDHGEDGLVVWVTPDGEEAASIGVDPRALRAAIAFVIGDAL